MVNTLRIAHRARQAITSAAHSRGRRVRVPLAPLTRDFDAGSVAAIQAVAGFTLTTPERIVALRDVTSFVSRSKLDGDIVECGVWRGGSMMVVANELVRLGDTARTLWLYDTYTGMTAPGEFDNTVDGHDGRAWFASEQKHPAKSSTGVTGVGLDVVRANLASTHYPADKLKFVVGPVEDTLVSQPGPDRIAVLRLDTDFYASTRAELEMLYPRLVPGGILILDDYGYWDGARKAFDEYFADTPVLLLRVDNAARVMIKVVDT